jgi:hypothetical protein
MSTETHKPFQLKMRLLAEALRDQIAVKLWEGGESDLAKTITDCGTQTIYQKCDDCHNVRMFHNHCDNLICPLCQPHLANRRRLKIEWWAAQIAQPKHVVLTTRNTETLTRKGIATFKHNLLRLRRSVFAAGWKGGCWSLEVTNEQKGWHLHAHLLIDAAWINAPELARKWASIVGQDIAIVKVKDARDKDYVKEVCKYAAKGSQVALWTPAQVAEFARAMTCTKTFGTWGTLWKRNADWNSYDETRKTKANACECGCCEFRYFSENEWQEWCLTHGPSTPRPPPEPERQKDFAL